MSYFFTIWHGPSPLSNAHATSEYQRLMAAGGEDPPAPSIIQFVEAIEQSYPAFESSPILETPLVRQAVGASISFSVSPNATNDVRKLVEEVAGELGLVAFDPQRNEMIPSAVSLLRTAEFDLPEAAHLPLHLTAVIGEALDAGETMAGVVEQVQTSFYVQWLVQSGTLTLEVQGEGLVPVDMQLDDEGRNQMLDLGFAEYDPNWSIHWEDGIGSLDQAAQILTHVLVTIRNLPTGSPMRLQTFPV